MALPESIIAIHVEGLGSGTSYTSGLAFYFGQPDGALPASYEWWPALAEEPGVVSASVNPFTGDWSVSGLGFGLSASDRVAALLMSDDSTPTYELDGAITAAATSATMSASGVTTGDVIWLGDEAIYVGSAAGTALTSLTRGYWGTSAQSHEDGAGVYARLPYWRDRLVSLLEVDVVTSTVTTRWRGLVSDIEQDGARIVVSCEEALSVLAGATVNASAPNVSSGSSRWLGSSLSVNPFGSTQTLSASALDTASTRSLLYQVDSALVPLKFKRLGSTGVSGTIAVTADTTGLAGDALTLLDSQAPSPESSEETAVEVMHEVVGWVRQQGTGTSATGYTPISGSALLPFHPISVCLTLLTSTGTGDNGDYDILSDAWSLGVDYLDWSAWETARDDTPELVIDRLILGWDGEEVNPFDVCRDVLRPFGLYLAITDDGLIYPARLRMVSEADIDAADNTVRLYADGPLSLDRGLSANTSAIRASIGGLPWADASSVTIRDAARSRRAGRTIDARVHAIDLSVFDPSRILSVEGIDATASPFVGLLGLGLDTAPILRGRVADHRQLSGVASFDLGAYVRVESLGGLTHTWLTLPDGTRTTIDASSARWVGILIERAWDPRTHSYTVGVALTNWRSGVAAKNRAPAAVVSTGSTTTVINLDTTLAYGTSPGTAFDAGASGEGDIVRICDANGVPLATGDVRVTSVAAGSITLASALSGAPSAGDIVRLAQSGNQANDSIYSATYRPWTYLATDSSTGVSDAEEDADAPDIYSTALFGGSGAIAPSPPTFVPVDNDAINGATADAAEPLDAWLEYTLRDNVSEVVQRGRQCSWVPITANAGSYSTADDHRPYASVDYTTILCLPWICDAGLAGITMGANRRVSSESTTPADVSGATYRVRLELGDRSVSESWSSTDGASPEFQPSTTTLAFSARPFEASQIQTLTLWGQSDVSSGSDVALSSAVYGATMVYRSGGTLYTDSAATRPNANALDLQASQDSDGAMYDHAQSQDADQMAYIGSAQSANDEVTTRWLSYAQIRSLELQCIYRDTSYPDNVVMRPGIPVNAEVCVAHSSRMQAHHSRARLLWMGPQGNKPYDAESNPDGWPEGYTERHVIHNADDSTTTSRVLDAGVWLDTTDPIVTVLLNVIPTRVVDSTSLASGAEGQPGSDSLTTAQWNLWASVEQLEDGDADWDDATSLGTTSASQVETRLTHWACHATQAYPALFLHALRRVNGWTYREGQLWRADMPLVQTLAIRVPVTYDHTSNRPARVVVHAEHQSTDWRYGSNQDADLLDLLVVGATIWEQPS